MNINERIKKIRHDFCEDNNLKFAEILGVTPQYASNITRKGKSVGGGMATKITQAFPNVNLNWLLNGIEPMLKEGATTPQPQQTEITHLKELIVEKDNAISALRSALAAKDEVIKARDEVIEVLRLEKQKKGVAVPR